ncbi:MAG: prepilin-type N-terminal cleavage/methylation domain-containing protein [Acidobacteria bacterium]|nr:prepilin-type N-terminal cleavage/methylation domain-containing protein [Acidobacteriota bacterium]
MKPPEAKFRSARVSRRKPLAHSKERICVGRRKADKGFTLVEVFITVAIIMTLAAIALPNMMAAVTAAKITRAVGDINAIEGDIALYQTINNVLPDTLSQCVDTSLVDPWGDPYQYLNHTNMKGNGQARKDRFLVPLNSDYDLYSMGPDGVSSPPITAKPSQDDIIRASEGSFVGVAADF